MAFAGKVAGASLLDIATHDLSMTLVESPYMLPLGASTPTSSERSHSESISSDYSHLHLHDPMAFQTDDEALEQFFLPPTSSASYYHSSAPTVTDPLFEYSSTESYPSYIQQPWMSLPLYSHLVHHPSIDEAPPSTIFPTFDISVPSSRGNMVPQEPQSPFAFQTTSAEQQQGYLLPSKLEPSSSPRNRRRSTSTLSRSCSPNIHHHPAAPSSSSSLSKRPLHSSTPPSSSSLLAYGILVSSSSSSPSSQTWRCAYPGCTSRAVFTRGCDLRKHFNRHSKHLFCRVEGCPQSEAGAIAAAAAAARSDTSSSSSSRRRGSSIGSNSFSGPVGGFSSKKDRARHEAKHNPGVRCEWRGPGGEECGRVFSRMDNMKDHVRRIHRKGGQ